MVRSSMGVSRESVAARGKTKDRSPNNRLALLSRVTYVYLALGPVTSGQIYL